MLRDVSTGRFVSYSTNRTSYDRPTQGRGCEYRRDAPLDAGWWLVQTHKLNDPYPDHTHEVCLIHVGWNHWSPTWPILGCNSREETNFWAGKLIPFVREHMSPLSTREFYDEDLNGDGRLGGFLRDEGWQRFNHIWWTLDPLRSLALRSPELGDVAPQVALGRTLLARHMVNDLTALHGNRASLVSSHP